MKDLERDLNEWPFEDDRMCDLCKHKKEGGCTKWECEFEPKEQ